MRIGILGSREYGRRPGQTLGGEGSRGDVRIARRRQSAGVRPIRRAWCARRLYADAAAFGDVLLLAIPWPVAEDLLSCPARRCKGKTVIDLMNAWGDTDLVPAFGHTTSLAEQVAQWAPGTKVVKAFNTIYFEHLGKFAVEGDVKRCSFAVTMPTLNRLCAVGTDAEFDPVDCGELEVARLVEPLAFLWGQLAYKTPVRVGRDVPAAAAVGERSASGSAKCGSSWSERGHDP